MMNTRSLQMKYNFLQILYWMAMVCLMGFAAIFLTDKGLNNTQIGLATGGASLISIVVSPWLSSLSAKFNQFSLQQYLMASIFGSAVAYGLLAMLPLPAFMLIGMYALIYCIGLSMVPLLAQISMEYIAQGNAVNFGLARGMGSISYAIGAVLLTQLTSHFSPAWLGLVFAVAAALFVWTLLQTPAVYARSAEADQADKEGNGMNRTREKSGSVFGIVHKYPVFFMILVGMGLCHCCHTILSTYLINLVEGHGGSQSLYGIAVFAMAASELPVLAIAPRLIKKFGTLPLAAVGGMFYLIRNCGTVLAPSLPLMIVSMMFQGMSFGMLTAVLTYHVSNVLKAEDQVMGQTMIAMMTTGIGATIGNFGGGVVIDNLGLSALAVVVPFLTVIGVAIMVLTVLTALRPGRIMRPSSASAAGTAESHGNLRVSPQTR